MPPPWNRTCRIPPASTKTPLPALRPRDLNFICSGKIETFISRDSVNFEWRWDGQTSRGSYLELRVGARGAGQLSSIGKVDSGQVGNQGRWVVPASLFFNPNHYDYEWQVVHMASNKSSVIAASERGCIHVEPAN